MPAEAPTIATALKSMGYSTGQFGKNHLGDR
jgi:arylsulfatase